MGILSRRHLIAGMATTALASMPVWAQEPAKPAASRQPNLLVIHCDQLNFRTLGCYRALMPKDQAFVWGDGVAVATPNIDSLAKNGALCDKFYAASPVCTPSRASFVSGRYPQNTGAIQNDLPLDGDIVTFAGVLRRRGYATGYAGKWHLDGAAKPGWTPKRQFGFTDNTYMFNRGHWKKLEDTQAGPKVSSGDMARKSDAKSFTTDFLADKAVGFIRRHKDKPFCYMVAFPDPHTPRTVRSPYDAMFDRLKFQEPRTAARNGADMPYWGTTLNGRFDHAAEYFGMVKCIDDNVGKILAELKAAGLLHRTIVVFTADHGDMCGEHGRNAKSIPLEASAKIPFLICAPGLIKPGTVVSSVLANTDFKPTILELMGAPADNKDEGRNAAALFLSGKEPDGWKDIVFPRIGSDKSGWMGAFTGRYKLVVSPVGEPCLLDLQTDPDELTNLFLKPEYRKTVRELGLALQEYGRRFKDPLADNPAVRADLRWAVSDENTPYARAKRTTEESGGGSGAGE